MFGFKVTPNKNEYPSFLSSALAIHGSVTPKVLQQVLWTFLYAVFVTWLNIRSPYLKMNVSPFEYAGLVMSLILVFRINAGYDRWWEARKIWGDIVNKSRNLSLLLVSYRKGGDINELKQSLNLIAATPYIIKKFLRNQTDYSDIKHLINDETAAELKKATHPTMLVSYKIANFMQTLRQQGNLDDFAYLRAEAQREKIIDCQGACERILKTPMPFVMAIKSRRFILLFLILLPFALVNASVLLAPFITALVAYTLFSLDQIGIELQNPFWDTNLSHHPLSQISKQIEDDVLFMLEQVNDVNS